MMNILFQGDSVTDAGRTRDTLDPNFGLGSGYATMVAGHLSAQRDDLNFYNRGVGGNRIADIYGRWQEDTLNIDFDVLSVLCGINDVGYRLRLNRGSDKERFRFMFDRMLYEALEKNPDTKLILMEPFVIKVPFHWERYGTDIYDDYEIWAHHVRENGEVVKDLAAKYGAAFVPLFDAFLTEIEGKDPARYVVDGVHPTVIGHSLITRAWLKAWDTLHV